MYIILKLHELVTHLLTPWSRVLLEKLTGSAASQEILRTFGARRFIPYSQVPATCPYPQPTPSSLTTPPTSFHQFTILIFHSPAIDPRYSQRLTASLNIFLSLSHSNTHTHTHTSFLSQNTEILLKCFLQQVYTVRNFFISPNPARQPFRQNLKFPFRYVTVIQRIPVFF